VTFPWAGSWQGLARFRDGQLVKLADSDGDSNTKPPYGPIHPFTFTMRLPLLAASLALVGLSTAHNIQLKAHARECFHEQLHIDDKMTVTFQVGDREFGGSGNLDIDFWVRCLRGWSCLFGASFSFPRRKA
jgi:hypothetical protein